MRAREQSAGLLGAAAYEDFSLRVRLIGIKLQEWLRTERQEGREISAYGASTKGNTLLQVFGLDHTMIRSAAERNPEK
jgi:NDP-4-keto-2,6-dideoxyhexose 3-C-methyltransferase